MRKARKGFELQIRERHAEHELAKGRTPEGVNECRRAEEQAGSNEQLHSLLQTAAAVVVFLSPDGRILEFNSEAERLYGQKRDDVLGKDYFELFLPEEVREAVATDIKKVLAGHPTRGFENAVRTRDGSDRVLSWYANRATDSRGRPKGILAVGIDVTERKRAEEALRKAHQESEVELKERTAELAKANEELRDEIAERKRAEEEREQLLAEVQHRAAELDAIIENVAEGVTIAEPSGRIRHINRMGLRLLGLRYPEETYERIQDFENLRARRPDGSRLPFEEWPFTRIRR